MNERLAASDVIRLLDLEPLPGEGGYFRQTWIAAGGPADSNPLGTAILYLVTSESWSALHRVGDDEVFHFYLGDPCVTIIASPEGILREARLGHGLANGEAVQLVVPAGWWQGTKLAPGGEWALLGTTMAPGFRADRFELASPEALSGLDAGTRARLESFLS